MVECTYTENHTFRLSNPTSFTFRADDIVWSRENMVDDYQVFVHQKTDQVHVSRPFEDFSWYEEGKRPTLRYLSKTLVPSHSDEFAVVNGELVIRTTQGQKQQIKILFYEDSRKIKTITFQRYTVKTGKPHHHAFTFSGQEIEQLYSLLQAIRYIDLEKNEKVRFESTILDDWHITETEKVRYLRQNEATVMQLMEQHVTSRDVVALAYRKNQLQIFERLLHDEEFFKQAQSNGRGTGPEAVWQHFFEKNTWIFGYGLSYIFSTSLDSKKLEQVVSGYTVYQPGKRVDALMKTRGIISSLCFVEIKTHETDLMRSSTYRSGTWAISDHLAGSVAQIQRTVQQTAKDIATKVQFSDNSGLPTEEIVYTYAPKAFLVVGSLKEFMGQHGANEQKYSSFEMFRKNLITPEIITFDELFERARFIVEHQDDVSNTGLELGVPSAKIPTVGSDSSTEDEIPF